MNPIALVISCEHAVDTVPQEYLPLFKEYQELLTTHRGIDFGALTIAKAFQQRFNCDFIQAQTTRLLIDCNRSLSNARCFSEVTQNLSSEAKQHIIKKYYLPFRTQVIQSVDNHLRAGQTVWHLSIHSFTPVMNDVVRDADIAFLYDPQRPAEKELAKRWKQGINQLQPFYKVRMNYPYKGISDGFTSSLRKQLKHNKYIGIEIESNQNLTKEDQIIDTLKNILTKSLAGLLT